MDLTKLSAERLERAFRKAQAKDNLPPPQIAKFEYLLSKLKSEETPLARCVRNLERISAENEIQLFYLGGFPRDLWLEMAPRDVDLVYWSFSEPRFMKSVKGNFVKRNRFGGLKLDFEGIEVDAWALESTRPFIDSGEVLTCPHILPEITFFTVESIVLEVYAPEAKRLCWSKGFFESCEKKILEIQNPRNAYPDLQLVRTYNLRKRLGWEVGEKLKGFISYNLNNTTPENLGEIYRSHYGLDINPKELYSYLEVLSR